MPYIAVRHYGRERKFDAASDREISAYKISGRGLETYAILAAVRSAYKLTLRGHSSYDYIDPRSSTDNLVITDPAGYLIIQTTDEILQLIEEKNRQLNDPYGTCRWNESTRVWESIPTNDREAEPLKDHYRPKFTPGATGAITTAHEIEGKGLTATRSDKDGGDTWWWIGGETYPVKDDLRAAGCRWSGRRRQWYWIGEQLPQSILSLMDQQLPENIVNLMGLDQPAPAKQTEEHAPPSQPDDDDGLDLFPDWLLAQMPTSPQENGDPTVYAKLFMPDADWYLYIAEYCHRTKEVYCYAILNGDLQMAEWGWQYVDDLKAVRGRMNLPMERDIAFKPKTLSQAITEYKRSRGIDDESPSPLAEESQPAEPELRTDTIPVVIAEPHEQEPGPSATRHLTTLVAGNVNSWPMCYLGTVSAHGDAFVFGYAIDTADKKPMPIYLNLAGPATAVEAAWARLDLGKELSIHLDSGETVHLQPPDKALYRRFQTRLGTSDTDHCILLHRDAVEPLYGERSRTYILVTDDEQFIAMVGMHVQKLVQVPVFKSWYAYLGECALRDPDLAYLLHNSKGGLTTWALILDRDIWTRIIQHGLEIGQITLPEAEA